MEELRLYSIDDLWMGPTVGEETIASEPVDVLPTVDILDDRSTSLPLDSSMIPCEGDTLAVFKPSFVKVFTEVRK